MQLLDPSCGAIVISSIDLSISDGSVIVKPTKVKWTTGMVATALGGNKIVRDIPCQGCLPAPHVRWKCLYTYVSYIALSAEIRMLCRVF